MERALVIGASGGIGAALCGALEARLGAGAVTGLSRARDGLDIRDEASVAAHLGALSGPYDLILIATGALAGPGLRPEKSLSALSAEGLRAQFDTNTLGPALLLKHAQRLLPRGRRAVIAALSARVGSIGDNRLGGWYSYRASKAALNQILHSAAIELGRSHPCTICVALHPGTVATPFTAHYRDRHAMVPAAQAAENLLGVLEGLEPAQSGQFFDWAGKPVPW